MSNLTIHADRKLGQISRHIFGHFSEHLGRCIYGGLFVGKDSPIPNVRGIRSDVVEALRHIRIPNLRWPGGCFADEYHWKDGIGPLTARKRMVNTHWGGVVEDNSFGTHEFMDLCDQLGCHPYINGNLGSGTVQEMQEWVEYITFDGISPMADLRRENGREDPWRLKFFGVGNENWGCGGSMCPMYYAHEYRRYQTYLRNFAGNKIYKIACGPSEDDYEWTQSVMQIAGKFMDALTLHYYTVPFEWKDKGSATDFDETVYYRTLKKSLRMEEMIDGHLQIMHRYDPQHRVGLIVDEWGAWYNVEPGTNPGFLFQQNTMRDAMVASATLDIFMRHSDRIVMANLAQIVNVLQAVLLTEGDKLVKTPTYHVFDLYKEHQNATRLATYLHTDETGEGEYTIPRLDACASLAENGCIHVTLCNRSADASAALSISLPDISPGGITGRILSGAPQAMNTFEAPDAVSIKSFDAYTRAGQALEVKLPPCSVVSLAIQAGQ